MRVAIVDYGLGNLFSIQQACKHVGIDAIVTSDARVIKDSAALILPGVGAFGDALNYLQKSNLIQPIKDFVTSGKSFLGICLGMQLMFTESEEFGSHQGFNLIPGKIVKFPILDKNTNKVKVPQIQWNQITKNTDANWQNSPLHTISEKIFVQFVHSYYAIPDIKEHILSYTEYAGIRYASSVIKNNLTGFQFHPEKSGIEGLKMYENWAKTIRKQF